MAAQLWLSKVIGQLAVDIIGPDLPFELDRRPMALDDMNQAMVEAGRLMSEAIKGNCDWLPTLEG